MAAKADKEYMYRALALAERGRGKVSPNPMVGAVIVSGDRIIAEGYHRRAGLPHAEIIALRKAGGKARGATLYVNLEPCCHTGATGPCTEALIDSGIKRLVYAAIDPDPRVNGKGTRKLRQAGIEVTRGTLRAEAERLNDSYYGYHRNGRPYVILKAAQTLDGRIATATGDSRWISGEPSLKLAHRLRSEVDAIVVGMGTVRADNPSLTVRSVKGKNPYRIVLTGSERFPSRCRLLKDNSDGKTIVVSTSRNINRFTRQRRGGRLTFWAIRRTQNSRLDLNDFMVKAAQFGLRSLLVEGGASLATSFLKAGLVDKYVGIIAPMLLGRGIDAVGELDIRRLSEGIRLEKTSVQKIGTDMVLTGYPVWSR